MIQAALTGSLPARQPYGFQGRRLAVYVAADGRSLPLYHFRARAYDPILGRFHQRDPLEYADGYNLYLAFGGNPWASMDPTGEFLLS